MELIVCLLTILFFAVLGIWDIKTQAPEKHRDENGGGNPADRETR